jgi:hypothetical protein
VPDLQCFLRSFSGNKIDRKLLSTLNSRRVIFFGQQQKTAVFLQHSKA